MSANANATGFSARLQSRYEVAERTLCVRFDRPAGFTFKAGQFVEMALVDPPETDALGDARAFSIASAPHEDGLMFATRMRDSAFKRALAGMQPGASVRIDGPFGDFVLHNNPRRAAVLLAGGIGITPFRSIALRAAKENLPQQIFLAYSNRKPSQAAFLEELRDLEIANPNYRFLATVTEADVPLHSWRGETGHITSDMLSRFLKGANSPIYYIAGPPAMVSGLKIMLNSSGVDDDDIRAEEFAGY
jgi:ferredoxin-NADP reductase